MKLNEVMNKVAEWKWDEVNSSGGVATFKIDKNFYVVTIEEPADGLYHIQFALDIIDGVTAATDSRHGVSDTGNEFLVFGTVKDILVYFLKQEAEDTIGVFFTAKEPSRQKLYSRFLKLAHKIGFWSTMEEQGKTERYYIMAYDDTTLEEIKKLVD